MLNSFACFYTRLTCYICVHDRFGLNCRKRVDGLPCDSLYYYLFFHKHGDIRFDFRVRALY